MAQTEITEIVKQYVQAVRMAGLPVIKAILFGSFAQNTAHAESDIDVIPITPMVHRRPAQCGPFAYPVARCAALMQ